MDRKGLSMDDLISRTWLLDVVENIIEWDTERDRNRIIHQVRELTPSAQQWIPVSERLPKEDETVLVTDHGEWIDLAFYDGLRWWYRDGSEETDGVTAWMPLQKPWEGGDS